MQKTLGKHMQSILEYIVCCTSFNKNMLLFVSTKAVKLSRYTPWRRMGGEEV
jgi:hypothetical protein